MARVDLAILHEIVRVIQARAKVPERVRIQKRDYQITYLEDHRQRIEEALRRHDADRLNMLFGQLASKVKYQLLRRAPSRPKASAQKRAPPRAWCGDRSKHGDGADHGCRASQTRPRPLSTDIVDFHPPGRDRSQVHAVVSAELPPVRRVSRWRTGGALVAVLGAISGFEVWTYHDCVSGFFHFDDFWVLAAAARVQTHAARDVLRIFEPVHGFLLYRPVSTVLYFFALREAFGYDPTGYHVVQIGFHVLNGVLVYAIADSVLLSRPLAAGAALAYVTAPGHAIAACWMALFTITGTTFFYFLAVWVWVRLDSRWRIPLTLALFAVGLLASEHAVSLPLTLTAASVLLAPQRDWGRTGRELGVFYLIGGCYVAAKLYYTRYGLAAAFPEPAARAYAEAGYRVSLEPLSMLRHLGRYCGFTLDVLYGRVESDTVALLLGVSVALVAVVATVCVLSGRWRSRAQRVATFGLDVFIIGVAPVLVLPAHLYSYYVGIAALGMALAIVAGAQALPRCGRLAPCALVVLLLTVHVASTATSVRSSEEFRFFRSFSEGAARWLYSLRVRAVPGVEEVVLPANGLTDMVFNVGHAHTLFLCANYRVQTVHDITAVAPAAHRLILSQPDPLPPVTSPRRRWFWLRPCRDPG